MLALSCPAVVGVAVNRTAPPGNTCGQRWLNSPGPRLLTACSGPPAAVDDSEPTYTLEAIKRMTKLKAALDNGTYHAVFDQLFPPEENSAGDSTKCGRTAVSAAT